MNEYLLMDAQREAEAIRRGNDLVWKYRLMPPSHPNGRLVMVSTPSYTGFAYEVLLGDVWDGIEASTSAFAKSLASEVSACQGDAT